MRLALIANPHSGTAPEPAELEARLRADGADVTSVSIEEIADEDDGDLEDGAVAALTAAGAPDRIVVAGGDGSIGPAALCAAQLGVPLAVIPVGTANDFARAKDLPLDLDEACALARDPPRRRSPTPSSAWPASGRSSTPPPPGCRSPPRRRPSRTSRASARSPTRSAR